MSHSTNTDISKRFRNFLPVVVDVETGGFNPRTDALLEIAAVIIETDNAGQLRPGAVHASHITPFPGSNIEEQSLSVTGIDLDHPLRDAREEQDALREVFLPVRRALRATGCSRAILVGHNPAFDVSFLNAAVERCAIKRNPFHPFSTFDTATLAGLAYGQTVLSRAVEAAGLEWDSASAHSAIYDATVTAELFCRIVNTWDQWTRLATTGSTITERAG